MTQSNTIVIADDDAGLVKALATRLEHAGYRVVTATDGYGALARAVECKPDLLILDIHMPAGDGFSVQDRKARNPDIASIPVVYITGDSSTSCRLQAHQHNAVALLQKPVEIDELLEVIDRALSLEAA